MRADVVVIGAGTVGASIAYGLAGRQIDVLLLDGNDRDFRAAVGNFGLVWVQGKGMGMPAYQELTRHSAIAWSEFSAELQDVAQIDLQLEQNGGLTLCLGEGEFDARRVKMETLDRQRTGQSTGWEMLDRADLERMLPDARLGDDVTGASFGKLDGHINPLRLLAALHSALIRKGGRLRSRSVVRAIQKESAGGFVLDLGNDRVFADRVVIAAGLGSKDLAEQVGIHLPIRPQRGQILVTERISPLLPLPLHSMRQTGEGTVMIGATHEEAGFDASISATAAAALSAKAVRLIPAIGNANLVRQWGGLRIMTPDSFPIYSQSEGLPGAFVATCHSGVTLAPCHADAFAAGVADGRLPQILDEFHERRFDVS